MQLEILGNTQTIATQNGVLLIKTPQAEARITVYSPTIIRICISKNFDEADSSFAVIQKPIPEFQHKETTDTTEITTPAENP